MKFSQAASHVNLHILTWLSAQENFVELFATKASSHIYTTDALKAQGNNVGTYTWHRSLNNSLSRAILQNLIHFLINTCFHIICMSTPRSHK